MPAGSIRVYADSSVYGGAFDEEFKEPTRRFFAQVRVGRLRIVISPLVDDELGRAPSEVRELFAEMLALAEEVAGIDAAVPLQEAYLRAGIVGAASMADALHVALATVSGCRAIVSWNFRHIVHLGKIPLYNGVNLVEGYQPIGIHSPQEVIDYEVEDKGV